MHNEFHHAATEAHPLLMTARNVVHRHPGNGHSGATAPDSGPEPDTGRGASTTTVMLAGNWKTSRMVTHYSAGATAERGAVARYL